MRRDIAARKIPIKNIYHMLSYAWQQIETNEDKELDSIRFKNMYNLLASVYIEGLNTLVKRGIYKDYKSKGSELSTLKGKLNIKQSINKLSFLNNKMVCDYDDYSADNKLNIIVKATIDLLLRNDEVDKDYKKKLKLYSFYFEDVSRIDLSLDCFSNIRYSRSNINYKMLIDIGELIYEGLLTTEDSGKIKFLDFIRDKQLADLYEKFVLNFYKKNLSNRYKIHSPLINWNTDSEDDEIMYLPIMKTDIVVEDKLENTQIIIDTKFYSNTLVKSQYQGKGKINSNNLYQIYSYINNSTFEGDVKGMLLYPKIEDELDLKYKIGDKQIKIKTINLYDEWDNIEENLIKSLCYD